MQRPITMLIADDSRTTLQLLNDAAHASKLPLRMSTTDNGRDCLTLLSGSNIDIAFIDVHMPELSGTDAFWAARKQGIKTFVTLMSSPPAAEAVDLAIKLRAYEFLFKPFAADDALAIIKTYARISSPTKVLIVDDSSAVRQIVQRILQGSVFNCEITEAGDGETALALCRSSQFDVVFLDCNMPGLSGLATMKRLALIQSSLKVVMISGERNLDQRRSGAGRRRLCVPAQTVQFARSRPGPACRIRLALAEPQSEKQRAEFRRRDRRQHDPPRPPLQRPRLRISVV